MHENPLPKGAILRKVLLLDRQLFKGVFAPGWEMASFLVWLPVWAMPGEQECTPAINPGIPIEKRSTKYYKQLVP
jgi:hypothetical protein